MLFFPYSAKNTPERFPYATAILILVNTLVYLATANLNSHLFNSDSPFLYILPRVLDRFALSWATMGTEPWRLITSQFLHAEVFHLLGNMIVLWVFGPAVEGRLGALRYLGVYLMTGIISGAFQSLVSGVLAPESFTLGASGAIMGLAGAYLWLFPFATVSVALMLPYARITFRGWWPVKVAPITFDWHAQWAVLYLFVCDLWAALWSGGYGGVANFAHIAGLMAGLAAVALLRTPRDGRRISETRKLQAEGVNLGALSVAELGGLLKREPDSEKIAAAYGERICDPSLEEWEAIFVDALNRYGAVLSTHGDARRLATMALAVPQDRARLPVLPLLRIAARLEKAGSVEDLRVAGQVYKQLFRQEKTGSDAETSLIRYAQVLERFVAEKHSDNKNEAVLLYQTLIRRFPGSPHVFNAQEALKRLGASLPDGF